MPKALQALHQVFASTLVESVKIIAAQVLMLATRAPKIISDHQNAADNGDVGRISVFTH